MFPSDRCGWKYLVMQPFMPMQWQICSHQGIIFRTFSFSFALTWFPIVYWSLPPLSNFSYLIASMGLQALWSLGLACLDCYALILKRDLQQAFLMSLFVVGDWVSIYDKFFIHFIFYLTSFVLSTIQSDRLPYSIIRLSIQFFVAAITWMSFSCSMWRLVKHSTIQTPFCLCPHF